MDAWLFWGAVALGATLVATAICGLSNPEAL